MKVYAPLHSLNKVKNGPILVGLIGSCHTVHGKLGSVRLGGQPVAPGVTGRHSQIWYRISLGFGKIFNIFGRELV